MKLVSKSIKPVTHFWVEDYNEDEKEFFLSLDFKEVTYGKGTPFEESMLQFKGSGFFGGMSKDELKTILIAMGQHFKTKKVGVVLMNPYD